MRGVVVLAAVCAMCFSRANAVEEQFTIDMHFSKASVSHDQFALDRTECLGAADHMQWSRRSDAPVAYASYRPAEFYNCMMEHGYQPDTNGWFAARFRHWRGDTYLLERLVLRP